MQAESEEWSWRGTVVKTFTPLEYVIESARSPDSLLWRTSPTLYAKLRSLRRRADGKRKRHRQRTQRLIRARFQ